MKAKDIRPGDVFLTTDGQLTYMVEHLIRQHGKVYAYVRYSSDGGDGIRVWDENENCYLSRPEE